MSDAALRTVNLTKVYADGAVQALRRVNLEIARGEFVAVTGPSGSGKTTLLNMLGALDYPSEGEVHINGRQVSRSIDLDQLRAKEVGFVFQMHNLIPTLTCRENVEIPMIALDVCGSERRARARELLEQVGLKERADFLATKISGGERQRVAIARALANTPTVLLADEPTGNLDSKTGEDILQLMLSFRSKSGLTIVVVTHNPEIAAKADRNVRLRDGQVSA
jgi:ABC-type lipoprotein export system ATPase subunit